mgnify:CR=1 FL=1
MRRGPALYRAITTANGVSRRSRTGRLFEKICLEGFQAGLSWLTILRKREAFRAAFAGFDYARVARFTVARRRAAAHRRRRSSAIAARSNRRSTTRKRAREMTAEHGSLAAYFWRLRAGSGDAAAPAERARCSQTMSDVAGVSRAIERSQEARLDVRRSDDGVRVHAGDGPRERPRARLHDSRGGERGAGTLQAAAARIRAALRVALTLDRNSLRTSSAPALQMSLSSDMPRSVSVRPRRRRAIVSLMRRACQIARACFKMPCRKRCAVNAMHGAATARYTTRRKNDPAARAGSQHMSGQRRPLRRCAHDDRSAP